jgi:hypothetical protein
VILPIEGPSLFTLFLASSIVVGLKVFAAGVKLVAKDTLALSRGGAGNDFAQRSAYPLFEREV